MDGANKMIKSIQYFAEADTTRVLVALDLKAAFQNVSRRAMMFSLGQHDPELATVFSRWYTGSTTHRMHYDGSYAHIQANNGIDQGCPLSPCGFAAAIEPISRAILAETRSKLDDGAKLWAYLDDWYIWIKPQHITEAIGLISTATRTINLELQPTKIQIWTASCNSPIPPAFQDKAKSTLKCLGAHLRIAGDSTGIPVELGGRPSMQTATQRFQNISAILTELNQAGLKMQTVNDLLTMYVGAASQHALRTTFVPKEEAASFDNEIASYWSQLAGRDVTSPIIPPPVTYGRTRGGLRGAATRCSPMDGLAINHPHLHGSHWLTRLGLPICPHTHSTESATPTPNHIGSANERTLPSTQITRRGTPNTRVSKSTGQHDPTNDAPTTTSKPLN